VIRIDGAAVKSILWSFWEGGIVEDLILDTA
jgi:hypothetical protein